MSSKELLFTRQSAKPTTQIPASKPCQQPGFPNSSSFTGAPPLKPAPYSPIGSYLVEFLSLAIKTEAKVAKQDVFIFLFRPFFPIIMS
jgi:hypothetical protein